MGLFSSTTKKKSTPAQVQARLKKRLVKKLALAKAKKENDAMRAQLAKLR